MQLEIQLSTVKFTRTKLLTVLDALSAKLFICVCENWAKTVLHNFGFGWSHSSGMQLI